MLKVAGFLLVASLAVEPSSGNLDVDDSCTTDSGVAGVCKEVDDCPVVLAEMTAGRRPNKFCGYVGFQPVVCCPLENTVVVTQKLNVDEATPAPPLRVVSERVKQKCALYAKEVYGLVDTLLLGTSHAKVNVSRCAVKTNKLIIGGTNADPKEFPHMVAVGYRKPDDTISWDCGGSLISEFFILTAAHCTYSREWLTRPSRIRVGDLNLLRTDDDAQPQERTVIDWFRHPRYKRPSVYHDIALLKVDQRITFDAFVRPACIPYTNPEFTAANLRGVATGWGLVSWAKESAADLQKVVLSFVGQSTCNESFWDSHREMRRGVVDNWQLCAGDPGVDTCQGDSGGPLAIFTHDHDCMYTIVGVTSVGKGCATPAPGVYTRVANYVPWIESIVWPEDSSEDEDD